MGRADIKVRENEQNRKDKPGHMRQLKMATQEEILAIQKFWQMVFT